MRSRNIFTLIMVTGIAGFFLGNSSTLYSAIAFTNAITHEYDYYNYNCVNFSEELEKGLYSVGAVVYQVHGKMNMACVDWNSIPAINTCNKTWCNHRWVRVVFHDGTYFDYEATTGYAIEPEVFNRCYRVRWLE